MNGLASNDFNSGAQPTTMVSSNWKNISSSKVVIKEIIINLDPLIEAGISPQATALFTSIRVDLIQSLKDDIELGREDFLHFLGEISSEVKKVYECSSEFALRDILASLSEFQRKLKGFNNPTPSSQQLSSITRNDSPLRARSQRTMVVEGTTVQPQPLQGAGVQSTSIIESVGPQTDIGQMKDENVYLFIGFNFNFVKQIATVFNRNTIISGCDLRKIDNGFNPPNLKLVELNDSLKFVHTSGKVFVNNRYEILNSDGTNFKELTYVSDLTVGADINTSIGLVDMFGVVKIFDPIDILNSNNKMTPRFQDSLTDSISVKFIKPGSDPTPVTSLGSRIIYLSELVNKGYKIIDTTKDSIISYVALLSQTYPTDNYNDEYYRGVIIPDANNPSIGNSHILSRLSKPNHQLRMKEITHLNNTSLPEKTQASQRGISSDFRVRD